MIKNNGGEMKIKIKAMVQKKEGSGIEVRGALCPLTTRGDKIMVRARHEQILPIFGGIKYQLVSFVACLVILSSITKKGEIVRKMGPKPCA